MRLAKLKANQVERRRAVRKQHGVDGLHAGNGEALLAPRNVNVKRNRGVAIRHVPTPVDTSVPLLAQRYLRLFPMLKIVREIVPTTRKFVFATQTLAGKLQ